MTPEYISALLLLLLTVGDVCADYACLCSYQVELEIFEKPDTTTNVDGYMYEFDCKPSYKVPDLDPAYSAVGNEGKLGFVQKSSNVQIQTCQGSIPDIDRVKTTTPAPTTSTSTTTTTPLPTTTTSLPTTTTTDQATTASTMKPQTTLSNTKLTPSSTKQSTQSIATSSMTPPKVTTNGTTPLPTIKASQNSCPTAVQQKTVAKNIFQHGAICYELVASSDSWLRARNDCKSKHGHLVSIENADQQNFVSSMIKSLQIERPVWLGIHDTVNEEEWHLDTGGLANYTNWFPGRFIDQYHEQEDCVLMIPHHKYEWDDVDCNGITFKGILNYPWICQYT